MKQGIRYGRVIPHAFDRGITYFDTAESCDQGAAEQELGIALWGKRDKVVLASKTIARASQRRDEFMKSLERSLRLLRTDYLDIYFNHAVNEVSRMQNPEWHAFIALAKEQGRIRFSGVSGHGGRLIECLDYSLDNDLVDVILAAHNFGEDPAFYEKFTKGFDIVANQVDLPRIMEKAHAKGVGFVAMKTLMEPGSTI